jgi:hypothetical protein
VREKARKCARNFFLDKYGIGIMETFGKSHSWSQQFEGIFVVGEKAMRKRNGTENRLHFFKVEHRVDVILGNSFLLFCTRNCPAEIESVIVHCHRHHTALMQGRKSGIHSGRCRGGGVGVRGGDNRGRSGADGEARSGGGVVVRGGDDSLRRRFQSK